ncbi:branched-chain amino acid transaminase [Acidobacteria bacterium AH-259-D05]|nr:branched-chain amino acid transaminase [Acidobacteria bacterium AH-259-D05]
MAQPTSEKIWHNGQFVDWDKANLHVSSHALHYGSSWFEGIRCYKSARGSEVFRLRHHVERLFNSCKIYRTQIPYSLEDFQEAILETIRINKMEHCYIRPIVLFGVGSLGLNPVDLPIECYIMVWEWGRYLGDEATEAGVDVCVSSWSRAAPNTYPTMAKVGGNYINSILIKMEAVTNGFAEGVALDHQGYVSEGSGENIFFVSDGKLYTPAINHAILPGITRDTAITLARDRGYTVIEQSLPREMLYTADEIFLTGTAAEITPIRSVDHITVGEGKPGPITLQIQRDFFDYVEGKVDDRHGWMTAVYEEERVESP